MKITFHDKFQKLKYCLWFFQIDSNGFKCLHSWRISTKMSLPENSPKVCIILSENVQKNLKKMAGNKHWECLTHCSRKQVQFLVESLQPGTSPVAPSADTGWQASSFSLIFCLEISLFVCKCPFTYYSLVTVNGFPHNFCVLIFKKQF